ncbi:NUDIX domain-containing protein [Reinekea thalattae]|uniref:ADP-ribose pyrophosphatase n=1 Tax=Reinekea thalattae TaxID=2593301 RepID=A0A5C8Z2E0_9GAMM|nr:NUDIX domain-containing protein [Reinekea thalattae]TXR51419.1 NUDIX domain-containing protein [Reinekea thalattae]
MKRNTDLFKFDIKHSEPLYQGFNQMDKLTITHQRFDGGELTIERELLKRTEAVCLLLVDFNADSFVMIEQFRCGALREANPWLIELVAGMIDTDESPEQVARREAQEEAGVEVGRMEFICRYLPSPGGTNERIHLYVGEVDSRCASGVHGLDYEGEDIQVLTPSFDEGLQWLEQGVINNAASVIALQWFALNQATLRQKWQTA